jgi:hypothetical protein
VARARGDRCTALITAGGAGFALHGLDPGAALASGHAARAPRRPPGSS